MPSQPIDKTVAQKKLLDACAEIERWVQAGRSGPTEELLAQHPAFALEADSALELMYTEFVARARFGPKPTPQEWYERFPKWKKDLAALFEVHFHLAAAESESGLLMPTVQSDTSQAQESNNYQFDNYSVLEEIGRGGMGIVLKGHDHSMHRDVAIKVLLHDGAPIATARFCAEARINGLLQHPGIAPVYEMGKCADGSPYFTMKLVQGRTLAEMLEDRAERESSGTGCRESSGTGNREPGQMGNEQKPGIANGEPGPRDEEISEQEPKGGNRRPSVPGSRSPVPGSRSSVPGSRPTVPGGLLDVFEHVCQTVAYAHSLGIVHRDLKPANIMVGKFGEVHVMDWGLAKVLGKDPSANKGNETNAAESQPVFSEDAVTLADSPGAASKSSTEDRTQMGSIVGTPAYMAPEQARGEIHLIDQRVDVFGLGAILCEILTGSSPYDGASAEAALRKAASADLTQAWAWLSNCGADAELIDLTKSCLAIDRESRPSDASIVAERLSTYRSGVAQRLRTAELDAAEAAVKVKSEQRARRLTVALAGVVVLVIVAGAGIWLTLERARSAREKQALVVLQEKEGNARSELIRATRLRSDGMRMQALSAARKAEGILQGQSELEELRCEVRRIVSQLETEERQHRLVKSLSNHRLGRGVARPKDYDVSHADRDYARIFRQHKINVDELSPKQTAGLLIPELKGEIAAFLDAWASVRKQAGKSSPGSWKHLLSVAQAIDPDRWRNQVRAALLMDDYQKLARITEAAQFDKLQPASLLLLVNALDRMGDAEKTLAILIDAQRHHPDDYYLNRELGIALVRTTPPRINEALSCFTAAVALRPDSAGAYTDLGAVYMLGQNSIQQALFAFKKSVQLDPNFAVAWASLGMAYLKTKEHKKALAAVKKATELQPKMAIAQRVLGDVYNALGEHKLAIGAYQRALSVQPKYAFAWYGAGNAYRFRYELAKAKHAYQRALEHAPKYIEAHHNLATVLHRQHDFAGALQHFQRAFELASPSYRKRFRLAQMVEAEKKWIGLTKKLAGIRRGKINQSDDPYEMCCFAQLCYHEKKHSEALAFYLEAFRRQPKLAERFSVGDRYDAACNAVLAAIGSGDARELTAAERTRWRKQGLAWLRAELKLYRTIAATGKTKQRAMVRQRLLFWKRDGDLAEVRSPDGLARLPAAQMKQWQLLWNEVDRFLAEFAAGK